MFLFTSHRAFVASDLFCLSSQASPLQPLQRPAGPSGVWEAGGTVGPADYHGWRLLRPAVPSRQGQLWYRIHTVMSKQCTLSRCCAETLICSLSRSILRHSCWQVWPRGDRPCLSAAAREKRNITGNPAGVSGVAHPESHLRGAPGFRQQASILPRLFLILIIWPHVQNAFDQAKCWALVLLHATAVYNLILSVFMR